MSDDPMRDWVLARPEAIRRLMIDWPPQATVKVRPGVVLMIPAPGVEGVITSWFENGTLGVDAPLSTDEVRPATGETVEAGTYMHAQEVEPDQLEIVSYAQMHDGTLLDPDYIRGIEEAPPTLDLRSGPPMTKAAAIAAGRAWLAAMADREIVKVVEVLYDDATGTARRVTAESERER